MDRRTSILDAALSLIAVDGMRGLTHRAVDAAAGIAAGSTSYYFRSRSALVAGCVDRLVELDREMTLPYDADVDPAELLDRLVAVGEIMVGPQRAHTLARYTLSVAAMQDPELRAPLEEGTKAVVDLSAEVLARAGADDPMTAATRVLTAFDGVVFAALIRGRNEFGAEVRAVVGPVLAAQPGLGCS